MRIRVQMAGLALSAASISAAMADPATNSVALSPICRQITVTQDVCTVFSSARNRQVDRLRLCKAAEKLAATHGGHDGCPKKSGGGMRVERVTYIASNKVEAVFSLDVRTCAEGVFLTE